MELYHSIDETFLQVILDGRAASTKSYLWAHRTGELANPKHPIVVFVYEPTRAAEHLRKYFPEDIAAVIYCDHYIAYETLESEYPITQERTELLKRLKGQIERSVPDLQQRVERSNQQEIEADEIMQSPTM